MRLRRRMGLRERLQSSRQRPVAECGQCICLPSRQVASAAVRLQKIGAYHAAARADCAAKKRTLRSTMQNDFGRPVVTVSELLRSVRDSLERRFPLLWVRGELSNLNRAPSGHCYFTLKDRGAQVDCVMYRSRAAAFDRELRDGMQVEAQVLVTLYEPRGRFQLTVEALRPAGLGPLYERYLRMKEKLEREGLFDPAVKRPLPAHPRTVGIVTSLAAAALRDVLTTLARRNSAVAVIVYPAPVQGEGAGYRIAAALKTASARAECDLLLLVRGGGSIEDLWPFNEESVARAIRASRIPVLVGVGHESDFTIADFAADRRAPTPTAAAELATPSRAATASRAMPPARCCVTRPEPGRASSCSRRWHAAACRAK